MDQQSPVFAQRWTKMMCEGYNRYLKASESYILDVNQQHQKMENMNQIRAFTTQDYVLVFDVQTQDSWC